ncbi:MAG: OmpA family protein [Pseudomonadota bacterium]
MCHWKKWIWPGFLTIAILSALAVWWKAADIETELKAQAEASLQAQGQSWATVTMDGRDATVSGAAPSEAAQSEAQFLTDEAYDVRVVADGSNLMAIQNPYMLRARRDGNSVELTGFVPSETVRAEIVAAAGAALPGVTVTDNTEMARGAPSALVSAAGFGLAQLNGLTSGEMSLENMGLSVSGIAKDRESFVAVNAALDGAIPDGATLSLKDITPPVQSPYEWNARYDGSQIVLGGSVPTAEVKSALVAAASTALPDAEIVDEQVLSSGADDAFQQGGGFALEQLTRFSSGEVALTDLALNVSGVSKTAADFIAAKAALAGTLPAGLALASSDIKPATISPYTWKADYDGTNLALSGFVPDEETRTNIVGQAKAALPSAEIADEMNIAAGAGTSFPEYTGFALSQLPRFSNGSVSLSDGNLAVDGVSSSLDTFTAATGALQSPPSGLTVASSNIVPPTLSPYTWGADLKDGTVTLNGYVPNAAARATVLEQVQSALPRATVVDEMKVAAGAPSDFTALTAGTIGSLPRFSEATLGLTDRNATIAGVASTSGSFMAAQRYVAAGLEGDPSNVTANILPPMVSGDYVWSAKKTPTSVVLGGMAPTRVARDNIAAHAKALNPDATIVNRMTIIRGAPDGYLANARKGLSLLGFVKDGETSLLNDALSVKGRANTVLSYQEAQTAIAADLSEGAWGERAIQPAAVTPYSWSLEKTADGTTIGGFVPNRGVGNVNAAATRSVIAGAVEDQQRVASGEPANFGNAVAVAISGVSKLETGLARLTGSNMLVQGRASSEQEATQIEADLNAAKPENFRLTSRIAFPLPEPEPEPAVEPEPEPEPEPAPALATVSPYVWSITRGTNSTLVAGSAPAEAIQAANIAAAETIIGGTVTDSQTLALGAPANYTAATSAVTKAVGQLNGGVGRLSDTSVFVQGDTTSQAEANRIGAELETALPSNFTLTKLIGFPPPPPPEPVCDVDFAALFAGDKILFDTNRAVIKSESFPLLDRLGEGLATCEGTRIEVGGHTDSRGAADYNQQLSEARARSVIEYYTAKGVDTANLSAKGYGETLPIADNGTRVGRAQNRRIEFKILSKD